MKRFTNKVQRLSQRAAQVRETIERLPPKIADMRAAVANTTVEVQKLRSEIMSSVGTLRAENDDQLIAALREIDQGRDTLAEAECSIGTIDLDLGPTRKLVVRLWRYGPVSGPTLRNLLQANADKPALKSLLVALQKADELTGKVNLEHLVHNRLTVEIGLVPAVRIGWGDDEGPAGEDFVATADSTASVPAAPTTGPRLLSPTQPFFERKADTPPVATPSPAPAAPTPAPAAATSRPVSPAAERSPRWGASALDRFKKMPQV